MVERSTASKAQALDDLIQRSAEAANRGDWADARRLAAEVLANDAGNLDAAALLAAEGQDTGEVRRISVMFCDLVGSTMLSGRLDPELYRSVLTRYRKLATEIIEERHGGHLASVKGDGLLALFGYRQVHPNDTERAVQAGLDVAAAVQELSAAVSDAIGTPLYVRAAVHRGLLYIDPELDDVYGLAANVAARYQELARPGQVVVSVEVQRLIGDLFETEAGEPTLVKGVEDPVVPHTVIGRRATTVERDSASPLIGRGAELARLRETWEEARSGGSAVVLGMALVGDAGIGKTRVASTFATEVAIAGGTVVHLAGSSDHSHVGLHPLRVLIEGRAGILRHTPPAERVERLAAELAALDFTVDDTVPLLAPVLALDPDDGYAEVAAEGRKLSDDIAKVSAEYVLACLGTGPALLVTEDHHAFDPASKELVNRLLRSGRDQTVLLVTSRESPPHRTELLELGPLTPEACMALVDAIAPPGAPAKDRAMIVERSDGVPLFLEELVRGSQLDPVEAQHRPARAAAATVPDSLYEPLMARLHANTAARDMVGVAAAIGRTIELSLLAAVLDRAEHELDPILEELVRERILEPTERPGTARFRHELLREVAYDLLPPTRRREVHAAIADLLDQGESGLADAALIATHLQRAGRELDAATALERAGDHARRRGDALEAKAHLDRAIELIESAPAGLARDKLEVSLRLQRGVHAVNADATATLATASDYERCLELCLAGSFTGEMISTITCMWSFYVTRGNMARARVCSEILQRMVVDEWSFWKPQNIASFAMLDFFCGDFVLAADELQRAVDELEALEGRDSQAVGAWYVLANPTVAMYSHLGAARFTRGDLVGADAALDQALAEAKVLEFPHAQVSECYTYWLRIWVNLERQAWDAVAADIEAMQNVANRHGLDAWLMMAMSMSGCLASARVLHTGQVPGITEVQGLTMLIAGWEMTEMVVMLPYYHTLLGATHAAMGSAAAARAQYETALELGRRTGMRGSEAFALRHLALLEEDGAAVVRGLTEALDLARTQGARHTELEIALDLHDLRGDAAHEDLQRAVDGFGPGSYPVLDEARARVRRAG